ncbi:unnamed protein product [Arctogadus glacialis]
MNANNTHTGHFRASTGSPLLQEKAIMRCSTRFHYAVTRFSFLLSILNLSFMLFLISHPLFFSLNTLLEYSMSYYFLLC